MANVQMATRSSRAFNIETIRGTIANIDGDRADNYSLPVGFGDCSLLDVSLYVASVSTIMLNPDFYGPVAYLANPVGDALEIIGVTKWTQTKLTTTQAVFAKIEPVRQTVWRSNEDLWIDMQEVDINATPTGDLFVFARVQRLRV